VAIFFFNCSIIVEKVGLVDHHGACVIQLLKQWPIFMDFCLNVMIFVATFISLKELESRWSLVKLHAVAEL
jgi:hypothetical protein